MSDILAKALLPMMLAGPPAPKQYPPMQMSGEQEEPEKPGSFKSMIPMYIAQLADTGSTEAIRQARGAHEDNPLVRKFQVGGSNIPSMIGGAVLEAVILHALSKQHPTLAKALVTANTSYRGSLAGSNLADTTSPAGTDNRLNAWMGK